MRRVDIDLVQRRRLVLWEGGQDLESILREEQRDMS